MEQTETKKRPSFLTVLCILSFVGTGLGAIMGIYHLATAGATQALVNGFGDLGKTTTESMTSLGDSLSNAAGNSAVGETMKKEMGALGNGLGDMMESAAKMAKYAYVLAGVELATNLLCLLGVIWMWGLKKKGYFVYLLGQLAAIGTPIALVGFGGFFGGIMLLFAIFPIAFIIMYAINLKHME